MEGVPKTEVNKMTDMRRITISFDKESEKAVELVKEDSGCSYSEAVRKLIILGAEVAKTKSRS